MPDLSSLTKDPTHAPCSGLPWKSCQFLIFDSRHKNIILHHLLSPHSLPPYSERQDAKSEESVSPGQACQENLEKLISQPVSLSVIWVFSTQAVTWWMESHLSRSEGNSSERADINSQPLKQWGSRGHRLGVHQPERFFLKLLPSFPRHPSCPQELFIWFNKMVMLSEFKNTEPILVQGNKAALMLALMLLWSYFSEGNC